MINIDIHNGLARFACIAAVALSAAPAHSSDPAPVPEFSASYQVRYGLLRGELTLELRHLDPGYLYETSLRPGGIVAWFKHGTIDERTTLLTANGEIQPLDYYSQDTIANPIRKTRYVFDRNSGRVTGEYKTQTINAPMRPDGHNRISIQVAIMLALQSNEDIANFSVFDRGRWKDYQFEVVHDQTMKTHSGKFETVEVRYSSSDDDKVWSIHLAQELSYLPVAFLYYEEGDLKSRAQLTNYRIDDPASSRRMQAENDGPAQSPQP